MVNAVEAFDAKHMKAAEEIPAFRPGDTVEVNVRIKEGNNSRIQAFTGVVIARHGAGVRESLITAPRLPDHRAFAKFAMNGLVPNPESDRFCMQ